MVQDGAPCAVRLMSLFHTYFSTSFEVVLKELYHFALELFIGVYIVHISPLMFHMVFIFFLWHENQ